jgi:nitrite reductase (cytochrome c-552)
MKGKTANIITTGIIIILAVALVGVLIFMRNQPPAIRGVQPLVEIASMEPDASKWEVNFPNQYSTFIKTRDNQSRTAYGGSLLVSKLEEDPRLVELFAGYSFSKDYNEDRGHMNSKTDVEATKRVNERRQVPATRARALIILDCGARWAWLSSIRLHLAN